MGRFPRQRRASCMVEAVGCPHCAAPAEVVEWHATSSLRTLQYVRGLCVGGHWFVGRG